MPQPVGSSITDYCTEYGRDQERPEFQCSEGHQGTRPNDNRRAGDDGPNDGNSLQQGEQKDHPISEVRMRPNKVGDHRDGRHLLTFAVP